MAEESIKWSIGEKKFSLLNGKLVREVAVVTKVEASEQDIQNWESKLTEQLEEVQEMKTKLAELKK